MDVAAWNERYRTADSLWGPAPNRFVRQLCEPLVPGEAVDLACGEGRNTLWLASIGWRVTGLDFSAVAIERARAATAELPADVAARVTWEVADVVRRPWAAASLDLVVVAYLHLPASELQAVLAGAAGALRLAGHLVVIGHDRRNLTEGVGGPQDAALLYDPTTLSAFLRETAGLSAVEATTAERPTDDGTALDTVLLATR